MQKSHTHPLLIGLFAFTWVGLASVSEVAAKSPGAGKSLPVAKSPPAGKSPLAAKRPSNKELEAALKTLVALTLSYPENDERRKMSSMAVLALVADLATAPQGTTPEPGSPEFERTLTSLEKKRIPVRAALGPMLEEMRVFQCRSMQAEAKANLKTLYVVEQSYRGEYDTYIKDPAKAGFTYQGDPPRYRIEVVEATKTAFRIRAIGIADAVKGDVWEIDENNEMPNLNNACEKR